ncbi:MAG: DUF1705 domain-containing protein [Comamonadaceae bacterium]|nr:DUF1705 domain-containing protein [Comamonadaceae bacterium]
MAVGAQEVAQALAEQSGRPRAAAVAWAAIVQRRGFRQASAPASGRNRLQVDRRRPRWRSAACYAGRRQPPACAAALPATSDQLIAGRQPVLGAGRSTARSSARRCRAASWPSAATWGFARRRWRWCWWRCTSCCWRWWPTRWTVKPLLAVLTLVAAACAALHAAPTASYLDPSMLRNVLRTDVAEARELLSAGAGCRTCCCTPGCRCCCCGACACSAGRWRARARRCALRRCSARRAAAAAWRADVGRSSRWPR